MIYLEQPKDFNPIHHVAGCFFEHNDQILLIQRHPDRFQGNQWGMPAGKIEPEEKPLEGMLRELHEEIGYRANRDQLQKVKKLFVRYPDYDFVYHVYKLSVPEKPSVRLSPEHVDHRWIEPSGAKQLPLVPDGVECIQIVYPDDILD